MNKKSEMNKIKILLVFAIGSLLINSCQDPVCDDIILQLKSLNCNEKKCQLDLKNIFSEKWDQLYFFHGFNTPKDISKVMGFEYYGDAIYDQTKLILEIANEKIIKSSKTECLSLNLDRVLKNGYYKKDAANSIVTLIISGESNRPDYIIDN